MMGAVPPGARRAQKPRPGVEPGDHVYVQHPAHGPMAVKVLAIGRDGITGECDKGKRHGLYWDAVLGHKARELKQFRLVEQGADGAILEDDQGRRRFLDASMLADGAAPDSAEPEPEPAADDPLLDGIDRLEKAIAMMNDIPDDKPIFFLKAQLANRPGLALKPVTDKAGHRTQRWTKTQPDQPGQGRPAAPEAGGAKPLKHGQVAKFQHGNVQGQGKIVASGADGVTIQDKAGREHQVRHEHLLGVDGKPLGPEPEGPRANMLPSIAGQPRLSEAEQNAELKQAKEAEPDYLDELPGKPAMQAAQDKAAPAQSAGAGEGAAGGAGAGSSGDGGGADADAPLFDKKEMALPPGRDVLQPVSSEKELYKLSGEALTYLKGWLDEGKGVCDRLGYETMKVKPDDADMNQPGGMLFIAPLKGEARAKEKVEKDYDGDWAKLRDVVRCTIAVDSMGDLRKTLAALRANGMELAAKPNDRFETPLEVGYRDVLLNVKFPNGVIGEVQLHLKKMLVAKAEGHHHYEVERSLVGPKGEVNHLSDADKARVRDAVAKQTAIYGRAWKEITQGEGKAAMATGKDGEVRKAFDGLDAEFDYLDHDGAVFRRRRDKGSRAVDDVLVGGKWRPYEGDRLEAGAWGDRIDNPLAETAEGGDDGDEAMKSLRGPVLFLKPRRRR